MSQHDSRSITVKVLGRDYQVACPQNERDALYAAARYLDDRMQAIRKRSAGLGLERIAIMTGLNMARQLMHYEKTATGVAPLPETTEGVIDMGEAPAKKRAAPKRPQTGDEAERMAQLSMSIREALKED